MITAVNEFLDDLRGGKMEESPIVRVEQGQLRGKSVNSPNGKCFYSFQGIPYAKPPLGSLRFRDPQQVDPWEGVRDATAEGNVCPQMDIFSGKGYVGGEDCLFLNVYTPSLDAKSLPVMLFIHGGGFRMGSGNTDWYGPEYLVEKDVVIVTINYRFGPLGFLCLNTREVPGNAGLKDMIQAIRWVKQNIHNFGGKSDDITLFGGSAGGVSVSLLTASPLSKDLISKAIIQSGTSVSSWVFQNHPISHSRKFLKELGGEAENVDDILEFLRATPVKDLVTANEKLNPQNIFDEDAMSNMCTVVIEKEFPGVEAAITEPFLHILTSGRAANVPVMIGRNSLEMIAAVTDDFSTFIPRELNIPKDSQEANDFSEKIKELYFKSGQVDSQNLEEYFELVSDKVINNDTRRHVKYLIHVSQQPTYYYKFDYVGELNLMKEIMKNVEFKRAAHLDEMGYLFKNDFQKNVEPTSRDIKMRERMVRLWTNFAKTGNPTPDENHYINLTWKPVTPENMYYLNISDELSMQIHTDDEKTLFWEALYNKHFNIWDHIVVETEILSQTSAITSPVEITIEQVVEEERKEEVVPTASVIEEPIQDVREEERIVIVDETKPQNGDVHVESMPVSNGVAEAVKTIRTSKEIKMASQSNEAPRDVVRANDPPEDDLPKNIGVNKFVQIYESMIASNNK